MKDQLVSFETAILAKEKGFSEEVTYGYDQFGRNFHRDYIPHDYNIRGLISAPTQSLLQKWLREKHNIDLWFGECNLPNKYQVEDIVKNNLRMAIDLDGSQTYEQGLELGLQESLKLL